MCLACQRRVAAVGCCSFEGSECVGLGSGVYKCEVRGVRPFFASSSAAVKFRVRFVGVLGRGGLPARSRGPRGGPTGRRWHVPAGTLTTFTQHCYPTTSTIFQLHQALILLINRPRVGGRRHQFYYCLSWFWKPRVVFSWQRVKTSTTWTSWLRAAPRVAVFSLSVPFSVCDLQPESGIINCELMNSIFFI